MNACSSSEEANLKFTHMHATVKQPYDIHNDNVDDDDRLHHHNCYDFDDKGDDDDVLNRVPAAQPVNVPDFLAPRVRRAVGVRRPASGPELPQGAHRERHSVLLRAVPMAGKKGREELKDEQTNMRQLLYALV